MCMVGSKSNLPLPSEALACTGGSSQKIVTGPFMRSTPVVKIKSVQLEAGNSIRKGLGHDGVESAPRARIDHTGAQDSDFGEIHRSNCFARRWKVLTVPG